MIAFKLEELELMEGWVEAEPTKRGRFAFPLTGAQGTASSSLIYFEIEPGDQVLRHTHSAEEVVLVLEGSAEVEVDGERGEVTAGTVAFVPAHAPHSMRSLGPGPLRVAGFFPSAAMVNTYEAPIEPFGGDILVTPDPEQAMAATGMRGGAGESLA